MPTPKERYELGKFVLEGARLVGDAVKGAELSHLLITESTDKYENILSQVDLKSGVIIISNELGLKYLQRKTQGYLRYVIYSKSYPCRNF